MNDDDQPVELRYPRRPRDRNHVSGQACGWLAMACVSATLLILLSYADATEDHMPRVLGSLLAAGVAVGMCGFIVGVATDQVLRRLDRLDRQLRQQREEGFAEGYVAATASGRHLSVVNDR